MVTQTIFKKPNSNGARLDFRQSQKEALPNFFEMKKAQPEKNFIPRKKKGGQSKFAAHLQMRLNTHLAEKNLNNIS